VFVLALAGGYAAWATLPAAPVPAVPADQSRADTASVDGTAMAAQAASEPAPSQGDVSQLQAPAYPAQALANKVDGTVVLGIDIDAAGKVLAVEVVRSEPAGVFDAASVQAAWGWRLPPLMEDGKPVAGRVQVPVRFEHERAPGAGSRTPA
jgi:TonB family protein